MINHINKTDFASVFGQKNLACGAFWFDKTAQINCKKSENLACSVFVFIREHHQTLQGPLVVSLPSSRTGSRLPTSARQKLPQDIPVQDTLICGMKKTWNTAKNTGRCGLSTWGIKYKQVSCASLPFTLIRLLGCRPCHLFERERVFIQN